MFPAIKQTPADEVHDKILAVREATKSLASCRADEVDRESGHLTRALADLREAQLKRTNKLFAKRSDALVQASAIQSRRLASMGAL